MQTTLSVYTDLSVPLSMGAEGSPRTSIPISAPQLSARRVREDARMTRNVMDPSHVVMEAVPMGQL